VPLLTFLQNIIPLNQLEANQNEPKQNQSYDDPEDEVKEDGYVKNGSFSMLLQLSNFCAQKSQNPTPVNCRNGTIIHDNSNKFF
jgi:hypothetical protein